MQLHVRKRVRLPHWDVAHGTYFVTFNLVDAVPADFRARLETERQVRITELQRLKGRATPAELQVIQRLLHERTEECLDGGAGRCWMRDSRVAQLVADAITHFDGERYRLFAWSVMPNHVHVVFEAREPLQKTMHSWKSFTAKKANRILARSGDFWQEEYYDRSVRDAAEFERTIGYVASNPLAAGLRDWQWVKTYPDRV